MADFTRCKMGDRLESKKMGEVTFVAYHGACAPFPVICRTRSGALMQWYHDGSLYRDESFPDLTIPPNTGKRVTRCVGVVPASYMVDGYLMYASTTRENLLKEHPDAQDVHEIEFTVREEENNGNG